MYEKRLAAVAPQLFTSDGTVQGRLTISNTSLFKVKQEVILNATGLPNLELEIKQIDDINIIYVGPKGGPIKNRTDISAYTVLAGAFIFAAEQNRPSVPEQSVERLTYEEEPTVARRVVVVDKMGNKIDGDNPIPIVISSSSGLGLRGPGLEGNISVGTIAVEVKVGATKLTNRQSVTLLPIDSKMYWGFNSTVTTSTGTPVYKNQLITFNALDTCSIWIICSTNGKNVRVTESA